MKKRLIRFLGSLIGVLLIGFMALYFGFMRPIFKEYEAVRTMPIEDIDLATRADGEYVGAFSFHKSTYRVRVRIEDGKVVAIEVLENANTEYAKRAEQIVERVLEAQSLQVDVISGATTTSRSLLKAMENALKTAPIRNKS